MTHENVAMIAGATGQDGAYLAELSLNKGHVVHGVKHRSSSVSAVRVYHLYYDLHSRVAVHFTMCRPYRCYQFDPPDPRDPA